MASVLAEMSVPRAAGGAQTLAIRAVISNIILGVGCTAIVLVVLLLGSGILPRGPVALVPIAIVIIVAAVAWRWLVRVYAKAQISLTETLAQSPPTQETAAPPPEPQPLLPSALKEAQLETIEVVDKSMAAGKLIRELQLRTLSGASAVAIERNGTNVINPGPDEELLPGDKVLLLGSRSQLDAARQLLLATPVKLP
jgi:CPA2 family monovalent cation:H+ antiporter-2